ncbi:MAG: AtpZ/AtpI family protein [Anaerovoracaceae bacterium]|jgi:ATP synthase protein I
MTKGKVTGLQALSLWTQLGLSLAGPIVLGVLAGRWLDGKLHTGMLFSIILLLVGIATGASGAYGMVRDLIRWQNQSGEKDSRENNGETGGIDDD